MSSYSTCRCAPSLPCCPGFTLLGHFRRTRADGDMCMAALSWKNPCRKCSGICWTPSAIKHNQLHSTAFGTAVALASPGNHVEDNGVDDLTSTFMRFINEKEQSWPLQRQSPTALMPPSTVVKVQMDCLMRNDWPDDDHGLRTAFSFAMPAQVEEILQGQGGRQILSVRGWDTTGRYLSFQEFSALLRGTQYSPIINCLHWEFASPVLFHGCGDWQAMQTVKVAYEKEMGEVATRRYTFYLEKVKSGAYKGCWMVVGTRLGDNENV